MYQAERSPYSSNYSFRVDQGRRGRHAHGARVAPAAGHRRGPPRRSTPLSSYHGSYRRNAHACPRISRDWEFDRPASRFSAHHHKHSMRSLHPPPSVWQQSRCTRSIISGASSAAPWHPRGMRAVELNEKQTPPPYHVGLSLNCDDADDELVALERAQNTRRIATRVAYGALGVLAVLTCALLAYFLAPRAPGVALYAVNSPPAASASSFKLHGTKLQFHVDLVYRVQNDNYFDMAVDDISTAVFWPETKFALGGGRLSNIQVPARRTVEITIPVAIKYDVKRGPPSVLLGMVDSCGLHDAGIGEMGLEAEVQADFHTKLARPTIQSGRQSIAVKCPVRRMATLQVDDGSSTTLGEIVRTLSS